MFSKAFAMMCVTWTQRRAFIRCCRETNWPQSSGSAPKMNQKQTDVCFGGFFELLSNMNELDPPVFNVFNPCSSDGGGPVLALQCRPFRPVGPAQSSRLARVPPAAMGIARFWTLRERCGSSVGAAVVAAAVATSDRDGVLCSFCLGWLQFCFHWVCF